MRFILLNMFLLFSPSLLAHNMSETDKALALHANNFDFIWLGASHMLTGYDHLLFIFGVIFFLTNFKEVVKFITAFTLGHSITLIFATFMGITANYYIVDAIIALTVIYKGFDNLDGFQKYLKIKAPNMLMLVFIFGLIHGFGLSTRLQELPLNHDGLLLNIISFNVGVELGQIAALGVMVLVLAQWRKTESFKKFSKVANILLMFAGLILFAMQVHGYFHLEHQDDHYEKEFIYQHDHGHEHGHDHDHGH